MRTLPPDSVAHAPHIFPFHSIRFGSCRFRCSGHYVFVDFSSSEHGACVFVSRMCACSHRWWCDAQMCVCVCSLNNVKLWRKRIQQHRTQAQTFHSCGMHTHTKGTILVSIVCVAYIRLCVSIHKSTPNTWMRNRDRRLCASIAISFSCVTWVSEFMSCSKLRVYEFRNCTNTYYTHS